MEGKILEITINNKQIVLLCARILKFYDSRLVIHGERVAYIACQILKHWEGKDIIDFKKMFILSLFHDIGAYKTEEIDRMVEFETVDVPKHSVYGSLFIKFFTPLTKESEAILYHHTPYSILEKIDTPMKSYAQLIHLADRVDIALANGIASTDLLRRFKKMDFGDTYLKALETTLEHCDLASDIQQSKFAEWILETIESFHISNEEALQYLKMLVETVDFKSEATVLHSINTVIISLFLSEKLGLSEIEKKCIYYAAFMHDIGKVAIPNDILEYPGKLNQEQIDIMRTHVLFTEEIIKDMLPVDIVNIAVRHHEKLDGSGYPYGLTADELSISDRIVAVADIVSALSSRRSYKEKYEWDKILSIISEMANNNLIDKNIANLVVEHYEDLQERIRKETAPVQDLYEKIQKEYHDIMVKFDRKIHCLNH